MGAAFEPEAGNRALTRLLRNSCRPPMRTRFVSLSLPGTAVPGFPIPPRRGCGRGSSEPVAVTTKFHDSKRRLLRNSSFAPFRGWPISHLDPGRNALGCNLPPLRG